MSNSVNQIPIINNYSPSDDDVSGRSGQYSAGGGSGGGSSQPGGSTGAGTPPSSSGATPPPPPNTDDLYKQLNEMQQRTLANQVYIQQFEMAAQIQSAIHNATLKLISSIQG